MFLEPRLTAPRFSFVPQIDPSDNELLSWANTASWRETFVLLFERLADKPIHSEALLKFLFSGRFENSRASEQGIAIRLLVELITDPYISLTAEVRKDMRRQCWLWAFGYEVDPFSNIMIQPPAVVRPLLSEQSNGLKKAWQAAGLSSAELEKKASSLNLSACVGLTDISALAELKKLQTLSLAECSHITTLEPLGALRRLESLNIAGCRSIKNIGPLAKLKKLQLLSLNPCAQENYLEPLSEVENLETLIIAGEDKKIDLTPLAKLRHLKELHLHSFKVSTNLKPLAALKDLRVCHAGSSGVLLRGQMKNGPVLKRRRSKALKV